ncbi:MAG: hypothetical protein Q9178_007951, partial [Gyalolechia marmorata]
VTAGLSRDSLQPHDDNVEPPPIYPRQEDDKGPQTIPNCQNQQPQKVMMVWAKDRTPWEYSSASARGKGKGKSKGKQRQRKLAPILRASMPSRVVHACLKPSFPHGAQSAAQTPVPTATPGDSRQSTAAKAVEKDKT